MIGKNDTKLIFSYLCLAGRLHDDYDIISAEIRNKFETIFSGFKSEGDKNDHESWVMWNGTIDLVFGNSKQTCNIRIKHFKVRIIIEVTMTCNDENFLTLFKTARKEREFIKKHDLIKPILESYCFIPGHINKIYYYPFIQILKEYKSTDFENMGDETITSFVYEVHDARRENRWSLFLWRPKKTLIRVSRPSIIATKMSGFMQAEIINAIYDTCLVSLRKRGTNDLTEEILHDMRDYIGRVLFDHEETVASAELNRSVNTLSIIMSIGAIASVLAIITLLIDLRIWTIMLDIKSWFGIILLVSTVTILAVVILSKRGR